MFLLFNFVWCLALAFDSCEQIASNCSLSDGFFQLSRFNDSASAVDNVRCDLSQGWTELFDFSTARGDDCSMLASELMHFPL
jgi:hypothetical protein